MHYYRTSTIPMCLALVLGLAVSAWPAGPAAPQTAAQQDPWAKYQIILDRNIFSRQRGPVRRPGEGGEAGPVAVPNPEAHFVLKGVVQEDSEFIAFIEDTQAGTVLRLRQDGRVARGVIKALSLDEIEYHLEDHTTVVKLGYDLEGNLGPVSAPSVSAAPAPTAAATQAQPGVPAQPAAQNQPSVSTPAAPQPAPTSEEAAILQRLMEQRKQQLGQ